MTVSEGLRASGATMANTDRAVSPDLEDARAACRRAVGMWERSGIITSTVAKTAIILIQGAERCKSGGLVNSKDAYFLAGIRGKIRPRGTCTTKTIRRHVNALSKAGLVVDTTKGGGGRGYSRGYHYGIDVSPLLDSADEAEAVASPSYDDLVAHTEARSALKGLLTPLRRLAKESGAAMTDLLAEVVHGAIELVDSIPRRFDDMTTAMLRSVIEAAKTLLAAAARQKSAMRRGLGRTKMSDPSDDAGQPTHTEDKSICRSRAKKDEDPINHDDERIGRTESTGTNGKTEPQDERTCDIAASDVLALLPRGAWEKIETCYGELGQRGASLAFKEASILMWHEAGGDETSRRCVIDALGTERGAMLLMLIAAQSRSGRIRDVAAYAVSCARKAANGAFMWGAALRSARKQGRGGTLAPAR